MTSTGDGMSFCVTGTQTQIRAFVMILIMVRSGAVRCAVMMLALLLLPMSTAGTVSTITMATSVDTMLDKDTVSVLTSTVVDQYTFVLRL